MRFGFTTGSCAAATAKAATYMLLTGRKKEHITIITPKGIEYHADIIEISMQENRVSCAVIKDGGDDPDATTGAHVYADVEILQEGGDDVSVIIKGGTGVGVVTKPGLDQPVGEYAINRVPRQMITKEVLDVCDTLDFRGKLRVTISIPEGLELANKTFNPRLGIVGGISVLGTSGIVEPMSSQALLDTIRTELNVVRATGSEVVAISPGNYGQDFMKNTYKFDLDQSVKCSNFIGQSLDFARELGFRKILFTGHIGKMVKVAGGIMNTHSKEADCRMEILVAAGVQKCVPTEVLREMLNCVTTTDALKYLKNCGYLEEVMSYIVEKIVFYMRKRLGDECQIECIVYENTFGELGKSEGAKDLLEEMR